MQKRNLKRWIERESLVLRCVLIREREEGKKFFSNDDDDKLIHLKTRRCCLVKLQVTFRVSE